MSTSAQQGAECVSRRQFVQRNVSDLNIVVLFIRLGGICGLD
jgi:hypothetical protein